MIGIQLFIQGTKLLIGIICISATIFQSVLLIENYNLKATLVKNTELFQDGQIKTPIIVFCSDPPHNDPDTNFVRESNASQMYDFLNLKIGRIKTALKGTCNILQSFTLEYKPIKPQLCFNASLAVKMYAILPGKQIFISNYHPIKNIESSEVLGGKFFRMVVKPKQFESIPDGERCVSNGTDLESITRTYDEYETCIIESMIDSLKQFGKTYYHPILDNYPQYESFKSQENVIKEINSSQSLAFTQGIDGAFHQCKKPCVDIEYVFEKDSYLLGTPDENAIQSGCKAGEGVISIQFSKNWEYAKEDYIIKAVDLLSGFGGAMGLWLGWSVMTLGDLFVTLVKSFKAITSADK